MKELVNEFELLLQVIGDESLTTEERIAAMNRVDVLYPLILEYQKEITEISEKLDNLADIIEKK